MSESAEYQPAGQGEPVLVQPGVLLRQAREGRGLEIADVVQAIKFSHRQVEALEADDTAALPGTVFVRGMVRSYARFLKMDPEPLVAMLETDAPVVPPDVRPPENMGSAMPRSGARQVPLLVALSLLLLIGAGTMAAWHLLVPTPVPAAVVPLVEPVASVAGNGGDGGTTVPVQPPRVELAAESPATAQGDSSVQAPMPLAGERQLIFEFHGTSWIEVRDAGQQIILTGQFPSGSRQAVVGKPPLQLVVGNADHVALQYGEQSVDLKPHTRAEVARLTLE